MEFFGSCILKTQILPAFIRYAVKIKDENQITKAINILTELYILYKSLENYNHSLISPRTEEYQKSFEIMFSKLKNAGVDFSKDKELNSLQFDDNSQIQDFILLPEKDNFLIKKSNFEKDFISDDSPLNNSLSSTKSLIIFKKTGIKTVKDNQEKKKKKSSVHIQNNPPPLVKISQELQKVYSALEDKLPDNLPLINPNKPIDKKPNIPLRGLLKKKNNKKKVEITVKNFEGQNFDVEKETDRVIEKMKNLDRKKLKLEELSEREGKLDKLFTEDLKEYLNKSVKISENSPINKLIESCEFLSNRLFTSISQINLKEEIPFKNLEINILLVIGESSGIESVSKLLLFIVKLSFSGKIIKSCIWLLSSNFNFCNSKSFEKSTPEFFNLENIISKEFWYSSVLGEINEWFLSKHLYKLYKSFKILSAFVFWFSSLILTAYLINGGSIWVFNIQLPKNSINELIEYVSGWIISSISNASTDVDWFIISDVFIAFFWDIVLSTLSLFLSIIKNLSAKIGISFSFFSFSLLSISFDCVISWITCSIFWVNLSIESVIVFFLIFDES